MAKRARGGMARWIIEQRVERRDQLLDYDRDDYRYQPELSRDNDFVFTRPWATAG